MNKTEQLKSILSLVRDGLTRDEFVAAFKQVLAIVKESQKRNETEWALLNSAFQMLKTKVEQDTKNDLTEIKKQVGIAVDKLSNEVQAKLATVVDGEDGEDAVVDYDKLAKLAAAYIPKPKDGKDGKDGRDGEAGTPGATGRGLVGWGAHPLNLYDSTGAVVENVARHIKFTGATLSRTPDGVVTVAVSASGFTELVATETPNGSVTVFTFSAATAKPSYVVADNVWLKATSKAGTTNWTWNSGTKQATLTIPPNDDIFAVV